VAAYLFCPNCGERRISPHVANRPVADFHCAGCREEFELKSQRGRFGPKVLDGAYGAKMARLASAASPNLMRMNYGPGRVAFRPAHPGERRDPRRRSGRDARPFRQVRACDRVFPGSRPSPG
jgi:hypothetical protein